MLTLSRFADRGGAPRRSPVEIVATMGSYLTRTQAAEVSGLRAGPFGRWADGVNAMREDCADCFHPSQDGYRDWARALLGVNSTERTGRVPSHPALALPSEPASPVLAPSPSLLSPALVLRVSNR